MKILWVVACWVTVVNCGVVPWSQSKEDEAIHLFRSYCLDGDKGVSGNIKWFCKKPLNSLPDQTFEHYKVITARPHQQKQVIFVQTPARTYKHNVYVKGEAETTQDTHIYVVPGQDRHLVDIQGNIETKSGPGGKPHTFYLQNNPFDYQDHKYPSSTKPSYPANQHPHTPSYTYPSTFKPITPQDHYPSYTHNSPRYELPPPDLNTSPQFDLSRSQEVKSKVHVLRNPVENPRVEYGRLSNEDFRSYPAENSRVEYRRYPEHYREGYSRPSEDNFVRNEYRPPPYDTQSHFSNHIRPSRRINFDDDPDIVKPHPDTIRKFSGFRNF